MKLGVIDLGFNSLKLVSYDVRSDKSFSVLEKQTVPTKLGKGIDKQGYLHLDAIRRVIDGLKLFKDITSIESISQVLPVATSGVRDAVNKEAFLETARKETGFRFKVLSGKDEALFSFKGAINSVTPSSKILFFDIGGGSLELVYSENYSVRKVMSLPLGGLRLTNMFSRGQSFQRKEYEKMRHYILDLLPTRRTLGLEHGSVLLGVGGTLRAMARYEQELDDYPLYKIHNYVLSYDSARFIHDQVREMERIELEENDAIGSTRAETIVAGSCVIELLMEKLRFEELRVSTHGLRDGVLSSFLEDSGSFHSNSFFSTKSVSMPHPVKKQRLNGRNNHLSQSSSKLIKSFEKMGLVAPRESELLDSIVSFLLLKRPLYSAETVFDTIIDQDSTLSHEEQLLLALCIVRTMSTKATDRLYLRYRSLLKPKTKTSLKRMAALAKLLEFVEKTGATLRGSESGKVRMRLVVIPNNLKSRGSFPKELLGKLLTDVSDACSIDIDYTFARKTYQPLETKQM